MSDKPVAQMSVTELFVVLEADAAGDTPECLSAQASIAKMKVDLKNAAMPEDQARTGLIAFRAHIQKRLEGRRGWLEKMVKQGAARNALIGKPPAG